MAGMGGCTPLITFALHSPLLLDPYGLRESPGSRPEASTLLSIALPPLGAGWEEDDDEGCWMEPALLVWEIRLTEVPPAFCSSEVEWGDWTLPLSDLLFNMLCCCSVSLGPAKEEAVAVVELVVVVVADVVVVLL